MHANAFVSVILVSAVLLLSIPPRCSFGAFHLTVQRGEGVLTAPQLALSPNDQSNPDFARLNDARGVSAHACPSLLACCGRHVVSTCVCFVSHLASRAGSTRTRLPASTCKSISCASGA
jgi:hypothetical protein